MVRKLYKHEFAALFKWIIPINLICLLISLVAKLFSVILDVTESTPIYFFNGIFLFAYGVSLISLAVITFAIVVSRFYKHLLSHEGYLTFTIPVSPIAHIVCKMVCGTIATLISYFIMGLSLGVIISSVSASEGTNSVLKEIVWMLSEYWGFDVSLIPVHRVVMLALSYGMNIVVTTMSGLLFTYAAMALGQRSQKNRVASAVGWYFIINIIRNTITSIFEFILMNAGRGSEEVLEESTLTMAESTMLYVNSLHISSVISQIDAIIWGALFFWITSHMLTKKLNLE